MVSKGLPSGLRQIARQASMDGTHSGATSVYAYNKINAHIAGRAGSGEPMRGANAVNRSLVKPRKAPNSADIHRERERQYRAKRLERELQRMISRG